MFLYSTFPLSICILFSWILPMDSLFYWSVAAVDYTTSYIVPTSAVAFSIFILDYSFCFSGTAVVSTSSPPVLTYSCTTYATTYASILPFTTTDALIMSSSFKLDYNLRMMNLIFFNLLSSIGLISECPTQQFFITLYFILKMWEDGNKGFYSQNYF